jgi:hypothetical protein
VTAALYTPCLVVAIVTASSLVAFGVLDARHVQGHDETVIEAKDRWAAARGCVVTPDGEQALLNRMQETEPVLESKKLRFGLTPDQARTVLRNHTYAYLDWASIKNFGAERSNCVVDAQSIQTVGLAPAFRNPDTGTLEIDGTVKGAPIYIDGQQLGNIAQMFVLSVGQHSWRTMRCEEQVRIVPNETLHRHCDRR